MDPIETERERDAATTAVDAGPPLEDRTPDRGVSRDRVACPLCEYDLRGLETPRCPECGYSFTWAEILDPARRKHRYLFEHHPERNVWSFARTFLGGINTQRFWMELRPSQPSRAKRLLIYCLLVTALSALLPLTPVVVRGVELANVYREYHQAIEGGTFQLSVLPLPTDLAARKDLAWQWYPLPPNPKFFRQLFLSSVEARAWSLALLVLVAWPWLMTGALLIFQISMLRAKVNNIHVLRCVVYCGDAALWGSLATAAASALGFFDHGRLDWDATFGWYVALMSVAAFVQTVRLTIAYRFYLQFQHAVTTVFCALVITILASLVLMNLNAITSGWVPLGF